MPMTIVAFVAMLFCLFGTIIAAASHTPYALAGWAVGTFVATAVYHKAPER
jgi:hypothetical protein